MAERDEAPPAKRPRLSFMESIKMKVGAEKTNIIAHEDIIYRRSPFFKAACDAKWQGKNNNKLVPFPNDDPVAFNEYLHCVHTGRVNEDIDSFADIIVDYVRADKPGDLRTANALIDHLTKKCETVRQIPSRRHISSLYGHTADQAPLCRLVIEYWALEIKPDTMALRSYLESLASGESVPLPSEFLLAVVKKSRRIFLSPGYGVRVGDRSICCVVDMPKCYYHQHDKSHPSCDHYLYQRGLSRMER